MPGASPASWAIVIRVSRRYEVVETADRPIALAVGNDKQFQALLAALDCVELGTDARFSDNVSRVANRTALLAELVPRLQRRGADEWFGILAGRGVPAGPINDVAEAIALADRLGLTPTINLPGAAPTIANPVSMTATPPRYTSPPPPLR